MTLRSSFYLFAATLMFANLGAAEEFLLTLRSQTETSINSGRYHRLARQESWKPEETAVIVCDLWDLHHSQNAVRRLAEFTPRLNEVLKEARNRGATIIHAPSDCMAAYSDHPARARAVATPKAERIPDDIQSWCSRIPSEEQAVYPLDQSDGGDDDDPEEHKAWAAKLERLGRNPDLPWQRQSDLITIDSEEDFISDRGDEVWNILEQRGIKNVILTGVHVNMCVLGRPFGLRQMVRNGKNVVLMRDMTDTMYNPASWPYVSHFTGNDLIISHIEKFVCPTITSDQLIGGKAFRFKHDTRPHLAIVMAEDEYETQQTLPIFAAQHLRKDFRVSFVYADDNDRNRIPGLEVLNDADIALISVRRRTLEPERLKIVRNFVAAGKPVVGIRTASHAFSLRNMSAPEGLADWPEFDAQVFGGHYTNHHGNKLLATISTVDGSGEHPILHGVTGVPFRSGGSLYMTSPLAPETSPLLSGSVEGQPSEPVAWTFTRGDGGRSFYTSLGHRDDFENIESVRLLANGIHWAAGLPPQANFFSESRSNYERDWVNVPVPSAWEAIDSQLKDYDGVGWYRCAVRLRDSWLSEKDLTLRLPQGDDDLQAWFNGHRLQPVADIRHTLVLPISEDWIAPNDANLIVIRVADDDGSGGLVATPRLHSGKNTLLLNGRWQFRIGDDPKWCNIPLPARYGTSPDVLFEP
ncbi:MAG: isochorismatase family protein [Planctomycetaceae bacterium]|nr:isochorismatase family protein [Planctomycetales bacterium]MCB9925992.1 isochorismatase family protein [Planctomycetaceae bacterium]